MNLKQITTRLLLFVGVLILAGFISANEYPIEKIAQQLNTWKENYPVEKVYLQFDKPYYAVGEDIWFKAYVTVGSKHQLSALNGALNVELIDDKDSVKQSIKLPLISGLAWGDFALSDTLAEGNYRIRAYTNYMRNAGEDYFFDKAITIVNASTNKIFTKTTYTYNLQNGKQQVNALINYADINGEPYANKEVRYVITLDNRSVDKGKGITDAKGNLNLSFTDSKPGTFSLGEIATTIKLDNQNAVPKNILIKATSANVDVQFFPESGSMIAGLNSKVAFKATGADGLGADIKGNIIDDQNNNITTFSTQHLGMGVFNLAAESGRAYKAVVTFADGSTKTIDLPKVVDNGFVLDINNSDPAYLKLKISASRAMLAQSATDDTISVIGQSGGQVYYAAKSAATSSNFVASIPKGRFPSGIVQFTLFSSKGEPLNERLVFIQNPDQLKLDVSAEKQSYAPREKVKINFKAQTPDAKPAFGSFSVAVVDETKVPFDEADESTILSNLLLTSDIKGYVEKPNYYFTNVSEKTQSDLDVLMLTQGYRRFEWKSILKDDFPPLAFEPERTLQISGHIKTLGGKPIANGKVTLVATGGGMFFADTVADAQGRFVFNNLTFRDSVRFVVQARTAKDRKNVDIELDNFNGQKVSQNKNTAVMQVNIGDGLAVYMQSSKSYYDTQLKYGLSNHVNVLKEVVIKDKRPVVKYSSNLNGPGNADQVVTSDQLSTCPTLETCLEGRVLGVIFRNGVPYSTRGGKMTINLDGIFVSDSELNDIVVSDIASVEVLRTISYVSIYGSQAGPGGVLLITTKRGPDLDKAYMSRPAPGVVVYSPKGYYKAREFYSPRYDDPKTNTAVADLRSTIYWNPNIITDKQGNASFDFFNAGSKGTYRVIVEGIDDDGNIGRQVYRYKVE